MLGDKHLVDVEITSPVPEALAGIASELNLSPDSAHWEPGDERLTAAVWVDAPRRWAARAVKARLMTRLEGLPYEVVSSRLRDVPRPTQSWWSRWGAGSSLGALAGMVFGLGPSWPSVPLSIALVSVGVVLGGFGTYYYLPATPRRRGRLAIAALAPLVTVEIVTVFLISMGSRRWVAIALLILTIMVGWCLGIRRGMGRRALELSLVALPLVIPVALGLGHLLWRAAFDAFGAPGTAMSLDWFDRLYMAQPAITSTAALVVLVGAGWGWGRYLGFVPLDRISRLLVAVSGAAAAVLWSFSYGATERIGEIETVRAELAERKPIGGVLSAGLQWVCATSVGERAGVIGGEPLAFNGRPVVRILSGDGRVWLWDPDRFDPAHPEATAAVSYPEGSVNVRVLSERAGKLKYPVISCP